MVRLHNFSRNTAFTERAVHRPWLAACGLLAAFLVTGCAEEKQNTSPLPNDSGAHAPMLFEQRADVKSVVYVIDLGAGLTKPSDVIKRELHRSISALSQDTKFDVVVGRQNTGDGTGSYSTFKPTLVNASTATQQEFNEWMNKRTAAGTTAPADALLAALELKPDLIFFVSDGTFDDGVVARISSQNKGNVCIYTFAADPAILVPEGTPPKPTDGVKRMQTLAEKNRGKAKVVTPELLKRAKGEK